MTAYYNENDPFAAQWLRNLINAGHIAPGDVDDRSIKDVKPDDLKKYTQAHFFAGIGVWSYALRLAGWSDDRPVWTGSCPCQPFSAAGKRGGTADERHLWPTWFDLIRQRRPATVFGEQVASKDGLGWFDLVHADLESAGYAVGAADLCAAGAGAPHIRQRLWLVAFPEGERRERRQNDYDGGRGQLASGYSGESGLANTVQSGHAQLFGRGGSQLGGRDDSERPRVRPQFGDEASFWSRAEWLRCADGKARLAQPGIFPLAHGAANRVGRLRAYGNAIVPQVAKAFIEVAMEYAP